MCLLYFGIPIFELLQIYNLFNIHNKKIESYSRFQIVEDTISSAKSHRLLQDQKNYCEN